jgi:hypothetical protein
MNILEEVTKQLLRSLNRLSDDTLAGEDLLIEIKRANAVSGGGKVLVDMQKLRLEAYQVAASLGQPEVVETVAGVKREPELLEAPKQDA